MDFVQDHKAVAVTCKIGSRIIEFLKVCGILKVEVDALCGVGRCGRVRDSSSERRFADLAGTDQGDGRENP